MHKWQQTSNRCRRAGLFPRTRKFFRGEEYDLVVGMWFDLRDPTGCFLIFPLSLVLTFWEKSTYFCTKCHKAHFASLESTIRWVGVIHTSANIIEEHEAATPQGFDEDCYHMLSSNFFPSENELEGCINSRRLRQRPNPHLPRVFSASAKEKETALAGANTFTLHYDHQLWWYRNLGNFLPLYMSIIPIHL